MSVHEAEVDRERPMSAQSQMSVYKHHPSVYDTSITFKTELRTNEQIEGKETIYYIPVHPPNPHPPPPNHDPLRSTNPFFPNLLSVYKHHPFVYDTSITYKTELRTNEQIEGSEMIFILPNPTQPVLPNPTHPFSPPPFSPLPGPVSMFVYKQHPSVYDTSITFKTEQIEVTLMIRINELRLYLEVYLLPPVSICLTISFNFFFSKHTNIFF